MIGHNVFSYRYVPESDLCPERSHRFLPGEQNVAAKGYALKEFTEVSGFDYLEVGVGGVAFLSYHFFACIGKGEPYPAAICYDLFFVEGLSVGEHEGIFIAGCDICPDAPHVVLPVGVVEIHAPPGARWRKAARHKHSGVFGQKGGDRVNFCFHIIITREEDKFQIMIVIRI